MKAIETHYKGYRFRSRLEARWAVFFETLKIKFEYEPEGYELGAGDRYLPDFWLPELHVFVEIKPEKPVDIETCKAARLASGLGKAVWLVWGSPRIDWPQDLGVMFCWDIADSSAGSSGAVPCGAFMDCERGLAFDMAQGDRKSFFATSYFEHEIPVFSPENKIFGLDSSRAAVEASRGARFEFGEKG